MAKVALITVSSYTEIINPRSFGFIVGRNLNPATYGYVVLHAMPTDRYGVLLIELPDNNKMSLINNYEFAAAEVYARHFKEFNPNEIIWYMYYPKESRKLGLSLDVVEMNVLITAEDGSVLFDVPYWEAISPDSKDYKTLMKVIKTLEIPGCERLIE